MGPVFCSSFSTLVLIFVLACLWRPVDAVLLRIMSLSLPYWKPGNSNDATTRKGERCERLVLEADLSRRAYLAGDTVEALITFNFPPTIVPQAEGDNKETDDKVQAAVVEWATIQLHGHILFDRRLISVGETFPEKSHKDTEETAATNVESSTPRLSSPLTPKLFRHYSSSDLETGTRFAPKVSQWQESSPTGSMPDISKFAGNNGRCIFMTKPEVLDCAYEVFPGGKKHFIFKAKLPSRLPPSYRGTCMRHFYMLSVGAKVRNAIRAHILHVPFRVLGSVGQEFGKMCSLKVPPEHDWEIESYSLHDAVSRINVGRFEAFLKTPLNVIDSDLLGIWKTGTEKDMATHVYKIGSESQHMAKITIFKSTVFPGEEIMISFNFTEASIPCYMISIGIETQEFRKVEPPLQAVFAPLTPEGDSRVRVGKGPWSRIIFARNDIVFFNETYNTVLQVPVNACPDFETELIRVQSNLKFEFVTARREVILNKNIPRKAFGINDRDTQVCPWKIPLKIIPPNRAPATLDQSQDKRATMIMEMDRINALNHSSKRRVWL